MLSVRSRHEKKVAERLTAKGMESFVPLLKTLRQWSDRKKWVELPLISCYVFVKLNYLERDKLFDTPGIVRFVMFKGVPATLSNKEIMNMKILTSNSTEITLEKTEYHPGQQITIESGPFAGFNGTVVKIKNRNYLIVNLDFMGSMLMVEISSKFLNKAGANS